MKVTIKDKEIIKVIKHFESLYPDKTASGIVSRFLVQRFIDNGYMDAFGTCLINLTFDLDIKPKSSFSLEHKNFDFKI